MRILMQTLAFLSLGIAAAFAADSQPASTPASSEATAASSSAASQTGDNTAVVKLETTKGDIELELNDEKAPISTKNFLTYVKEGYYNGTIFHRIMPDFMIQGGGYTAIGVKKPGQHAPIKNEWQNGLKNERGTIAMARTSNPDSATSEFFINVKDNAMLDQPNDGAAYCVFGKVIKGMDVVDTIKNMPTSPNPDMPNETSLPKEPVVITKATVEQMTPALEKAINAEKNAAAEALKQQQQQQEKDVAGLIDKLKSEAGGKMTKTDEGVMIFPTKEGSGPSPTLADMVKLNFTVSLPNGQELFSTKTSGQAQSVPMAVLTRSVKGLAIALQKMKAGESAKVLLPPAMAFGDAGTGAVPPNSDVLFDVDLLSVQPAASASTPAMSSSPASEPASKITK